MAALGRLGFCKKEHGTNRDGGVTERCRREVAGGSIYRLFKRHPRGGGSQKLPEGTETQNNRRWLAAPGPHDEEQHA